MEDDCDMILFGHGDLIGKLFCQVALTGYFPDGTIALQVFFPDFMNGL